jgi:8-oxo-dGTP pyrophosphatase MutT (NUDIX family)
MNFEPQKFFVGLIDFFSIFMPGAVLAYLVKDWGASKFLGLKDGYPLSGPEAGIVFFFASYLLGHFAFLLSAALDEWVYDPLRAWTDWGQITKQLARGRDLSAPWQRKLAASDLLFGGNADNAVMQAQKIKARALHGLEAEDAINAFQWCKARLTEELPEGLLAVQRFEADSKFFRSFFVVLGALAVVYASQGKWFQESLCFAGMLPALWRYIDQRFKATQQAYWFIITLEAKKNTVPAAAPLRQDGLSRAGGIVYRRMVENDVEVVKFMLVEASKKRSEWVLPKGRIEPGEDPRDTAVREIKEETGHWAKLVDWLEDSRLDEDASDPPVRWFLLEFCEKPEKWRHESRQNAWFPLPAAIQKAEFKETKALLQRADEKLRSIAKIQAARELTRRT